MMIADTNTINREACEWIAKLHDGDPSPQELSALEAWMKQSPEHSAELRRMAKRWDELNVLTELAVSVEVSSANRISKRLFFWSFFGRRGAIGAVATVAVLMAITTFWSPLNFLDKDAPPSSVYATAIGEQRLVTLADDSTVLLNTNSQLRVDYNGEFRNLYLIQGEAFFDVASNRSRPFRVFAGSGMISAVGTAFSVYLKEKTVEVTVTEGSVEIRGAQYTGGGGELSTTSIKNRPVVNAGQVAIYDQHVKSIESIASVDQVEVSRKLAWQDGLLRFSGDPLGEVVQEVSRYTSLSIVILDPELRDLRIGGSFEVGETEKMFEALQSGFAVRVERIDESLVHLSLLAHTPSKP
jgi:transmembrane sensor